MRAGWQLEGAGGVEWLSRKEKKSEKELIGMDKSVVIGGGGEMEVEEGMGE